MEANENKVTRKGSTPIKVYCLPDERAAIEANAQAAGMSTSAYLLAVGQGYQVKGVTDFENVRDLVRVNGDLGRLGGLLKLWLTDDPRTARFGDDTIRALFVDDFADGFGRDGFDIDLIRHFPVRHDGDVRRPGAWPSFSFLPPEGRAEI